MHARPGGECDAVAAPGSRPGDRQVIKIGTGQADVARGDGGEQCQRVGRIGMINMRPGATYSNQRNSGGKFDERQDYLRINNTLLTPGEVAERVIEHFALPRFTETNPT